MKEEKETFGQKIHKYSNSTIELISDLLITKEIHISKVSKAVVTSKTEEEAVQKLTTLENTSAKKS